MGVQRKRHALQPVRPTIYIHMYGMYVRGQMYYVSLCFGNDAVWFDVFHLHLAVRSYMMATIKGVALVFSTPPYPGEERA